ncbi:TIM barrel protein [Paenibacillus mucilaginosus]|nr:TIM barrel protein [Paenibacillus caseinilyticus]
MSELGVDHIELWAGEPHLYVYRSILGNMRSVRKQVRARGMKIVCYTPEQCIYPYNIAASDAHWRHKSVEYFMENLYAALELGTDTMLITSGIGDFAAAPEESWKYARESIFQLCRIAEQEGLTLALEPLTPFESNLITDVRGVRRMIDEIGSPALQGMLDTVAMQLAGEVPEDYFALLPKVCHVHLIDGDGRSDAHLARSTEVEGVPGEPSKRRLRGSVHTGDYGARVLSASEGGPCGIHRQMEGTRSLTNYLGGTL